MRPNVYSIRQVAVVLCLLARVCRADVATARHGMVATVHPAATDAAVAMLHAGGNAVDAAVAAAFTLGVVDGHNSGIGGGCFMLIRTPDGRFFALDGRETAPAAASPDMFVRDGRADTRLSQNGALASGIPGSVAVYEYASKHFGRKALAEALTPAADLAERGFPLDAGYARRLEGTAKLISAFPGTAAVLLHPNGAPYKEGELLKQPDLARTYRQIAQGGADVFYRGAFAKAVGDWMQENHGILTAEDFARYHMELREPIVSTYRGYTVVGFPPPSSGGVHVAQVLNILEHFDLATLQRKDAALRINVTAEAMNRAFADRAFWLGDPAFVHVPKGLVDRVYATDQAKTITPGRASPGVVHGTPPAAAEDYFGKHTTHIVAADDQGNWVSLTATVNTSFGSKVIVPGTGVILNDQMDDFAIQPGVANAFGLVGGEANAPAPGKRPLSSMSPTIVLKDGTPVMALGAAGGPKIISQVILLISNVLDLGDDLGHAISRPRFHHQWSPPELWVEAGTDPGVIASLEHFGHTVKQGGPAGAGASQAIHRLPDGTLVGASEPRVSGKAAGF